MVADRSHLSPLQELLSLGGSCLAQGYAPLGSSPHPITGSRSGSDLFHLNRNNSEGPSQLAPGRISHNCLSSLAFSRFSVLRPPSSPITGPGPKCTPLKSPHVNLKSLRVSKGESGIWILFQLELSNRYLVCDSGAQRRRGAEDIDLQVVSSG